MSNAKLLWQKLNEERTEGKWYIKYLSDFENYGKTGDKITAHLYADNILQETGEIKHTPFISEFHFARNSDELQANAAYTALAVNNLHVLAQALQNFILISEQRSEFHSPFEAATLLQAKEALSRIS